jgi:hypothetical protein
MEPLRLEDVEKTAEVDEVTSAIRDGRAGHDWVRLYSANGKHSASVRQDPERPTDG